MKSDRLTIRGSGFFNKVVLAFLVSAPYLSSFGQHDFTLWSMEKVPQRIYLNPAFIPETNSYLGIPLLSGVHISLVNPFSYNNVLTREEDDSLNFEAENFLSKIAVNNRISVFSAFDIISAGGKIAKGKFFINFGLRERMYQNTLLQEELFHLLWYGNTSSRLWQQHVNISPSINASVYDEWSFSFSGYALKQRLTYGVSLKYLSGRINIHTKQSELFFFTDPESYNLLMSSDIEVQTSGVHEIDSYFNQRLPSLIFSGNNGLAVDVGAAFKIDEHFSVSGAVRDLGFITWKSQTMALVSRNPGEEVTYSGMPMNEFAGLFGDFSKFGTTVLDSLRELLPFDTVYGEKYTTFLPVRINVAGTYSPDDRNHINLLLTGISSDHHFSPGISLSYFFRWSSHVGLSLSYNIFNRQYTNLGGGISVSAGPLQLYLVSDNLPGLVFYKSTNNTSFQFGINIAFSGKTSNVGMTKPESTPETQVLQETTP